MRALVVYGSKRGGTAGLAEMIGDALIADGQRAVATGPAGGKARGDRWSARTRNLWRPLAIRRQGFPGERNGQEEVRRLARSRSRP
jgi:hypothetical protein